MRYALTLLPCFVLFACTGDSSSSSDASTPDGALPSDAGPGPDATVPGDAGWENDAGPDARDAAADARADASSSDASDASDGADAADGATALASIFVSDYSVAHNSGIIYGFPADGGGGVPTQVFYSQRDIRTASDVAVDTAGYIYVGDIETDPTKNSVQVFAPGSQGVATPVRVISGPSTTLSNGVASIHVLADGRLYVGNGSNILVFAAGASGDVAPIQSMVPMGNVSANGVGVGVGGGPLYFTGTSEINVYPGSSSGPTQPIATIHGAPPRPGNVDLPQRLTVDPAGNMYDLDVGSACVLVFAPNAGATDRPLRSFVMPGSVATPGGGITLDRAGRIYLVLTSDGGGGGPRVVVYPANADGPGAAPVFTMISPSFLGPTGIATTL